MPDSRLRWDWTKAVVERGPPSPTTRHVLLTLALHMDGSGANCRPSSTLLAEETRLTGRAVREHLIRAESEGWIRRKKRGRVYLYTPTIPPTPEDETPEGGSGVDESKPRKEVPGSGATTQERGSGVGGPDLPETPEGGSGVTTPEGGSTVERGSGQPRKEVPAYRGRQGGSRQEEAPIDSPVTTTLLPSGTSEGDRQEGDTHRRETHPLTHELWSADVRGAVVDVWHRGSERIEIHDDDVGLGAEFAHASDLLHDTDGDVDFVRWLIVDAPRVLEWDDRPRTLAWAKHPRQLGPALKAYSERNPAGGPNGLPNMNVGSAPNPKRADDETEATRRKLHGQVEKLKREQEAGGAP